MQDDQQAAASADDKVSFRLAAPLSAGSDKGVAIVGVLTVVALIGVIVFGWSDRGVPWDMIAAVMVAMLPALGIMFWRSYRSRISRASELVISRDGIYAPRMASSLVPWSTIERIAMHQSFDEGIGQDEVMALHVADSTTFGPQLSPAGREACRQQFGSDLVFPTKALAAATPKDVVAAIERFAPADLVTRSSLMVGQG